VRAGDRTALGRAITLVESSRPDHRRMAQELLTRLAPQPGDGESGKTPGAGTVRVGVTGLPGSGKSTFIDQLGTNLTGTGHRVAVLAVDPSSSITHGSILGDKTRMPRLANDPAAFVRPSPTAGTLGGVTRTTRETMLVCEAAGFDVVLVETVGVGQSEIVVVEMVDFFLVLTIAGAGDHLQGLKKGVIELADLIAVNKADGATAEGARVAASEYQAALHLLAPRDDGWTAPVVTCSGLHDSGLDTIWDHVLAHRRLMTDSGRFAARRREQRVTWLWSAVEHRLMEALRADPSVAAALANVERQVRDGALPPGVGADELIARFQRGSEPLRSDWP
jgi:LAO/AO transport system kinase